MNVWLKQKIFYYLITLILRWKTKYLILAKHLLFSRNHFFCFQKWKFLGAPTQVEFTIFYLFILFLKICTCVLLNDIEKYVWQKLKNIWFAETRFSNFALQSQNKTKQKSFCTHFCRHCKHYKENTCSKCQRKTIISTWQIVNKLISKNNNINSKDNNINMN